MYRTAAQRLVSPHFLPSTRLRERLFSTGVNSSRYSPANQSPNLPQRPLQPPPTPEVLDQPHATSSSSTTSSSSSSSTQQQQPPPRFDSQQQSSRARRKRAIDFEEEHASVLQASLRHVNRLGWNQEAMIAGARDVELSPSIVGSFPRKEAALVEFFMDKCLDDLIDRIESEEGLKNLIISERVSKLVRIRLEMQAPYISKWPQALSIQALPQNVPTSFKQRAMLVDEIWHAVGDEGSDIDWYVKRTILGGIYSTTEVYMLTDSSPEFHDTWAFLDSRVKDAFELKKTMREMQHLAEAVGTGMGISLDGFMKGIFQR
ncbi:COQ9 [Dillenia turbinata]|uniref:Ubiquinone biosynthesis protein n=1 Tax=Dillenia turbinata TaxID=194707 RepID=A0AAN8W2A9_9MAGN